MDYSTVKSELDPIITSNKHRLDEIQNEINELKNEIDLKYQKLNTLMQEQTSLQLEQTRIQNYFEMLTGLYYASLIVKKTGEPLGGLYYRTNQLNFNELSNLVAEFKIYEVLHIMNVITTNRIICQRGNTEYITNELIDDLLVLHNCIQTCSDLYHRFVKKYGSSNVIDLLTINLTNEQKESIVTIALKQEWNQHQIIRDLMLAQKDNNIHIDRLIAKTNGSKLYRESEYFIINQNLTRKMSEEKKKLRIYQAVASHLRKSTAQTY